jgi:hypothetical protein
MKTLAGEAITQITTIVKPKTSLLSVMLKTLRRSNMSIEEMTAAPGGGGRCLPPAVLGIAVFFDT